MPIGSRNFAANVETDRASILLLFTDHEAKIVRDWQFVKRYDRAKDDRDVA